MEKVEIRYSIKYLLLEIFGNLVFVVLGFYLLTVINFNELKNFKVKDFIIPLLSILFIFSFGKKVITECLNFRKKIILSRNGIELNKRLFKWQDIRKQKIISKKGSTPKYNFK